jgi:hypothetical protein
MSRKGKSKAPVAVDGPWFGMPCEFLASRACAELSPLASKMLLNLMGQLRSNHHGNGRIDAHANTLRRHGWKGTASARAALQELIEASLVVCTKRGHKGITSLYGITLFPMHCDPKGLDVGPGAWRAAEWRERPETVAPPTSDRPALWARPRAGEKRSAGTRSGKAKPECAPAAGIQEAPKQPCVPAAGAHPAGLSRNAFPLRVPPLRDAICTELIQPTAGAESQPNVQRRTAMQQPVQPVQNPSQEPIATTLVAELTPAQLAWRNRNSRRLLRRLEREQLNEHTAALQGVRK